MGGLIAMNSIQKSALLGCATLLVGGCAMQQNAAPEYRLSSSAPVAVSGASMLQRGRAQLDAGLDALAIESFRAEIRFNQENADAYNGLAVAYGRIGRGDLAQRYFETALAKDPDNGKAQSNLARLTGEDVPLVQLTEVAAPVATIEPVAVTSLIDADPIVRILDSIEMPTVASSITTPSVEFPVSAPAQVYALARQGVLSTRFAAAPARLATASMPRKPVELPALPEPSLPVGNVAIDYRAAGIRLVRVSLGEVHLITRQELPVKLARIQPEFKSFGDRLAVWLPQSIAVEQTSAARAINDDAILMAAINRAIQDQKLAQVDDIALPDLPEFAYLFFADGHDAANV